MSGRPRYPADGLQLSLLASEEGRASEGLRWDDERCLRIELKLFSDRLVADAGLADSTASARAHTLAGMVRAADCGTATRFFSIPHAAAEQIRQAATRKARGVRHLVVQDFLQLCGDLLPEGAASRCREQITLAFPARTRPMPGLIDIDLGGSRKEVGQRVPLSWDDGWRLIEAAASESGSAVARSVAVMALLVRSSLPPSVIEALNWETVASLIQSTETITVLHQEHRGRSVSFLLHADAIAALRALWRDMGEPARGPIFAAIHGRRQRLSSARIALIVRTAQANADFSSINQRHLRAPFARWLIVVRGWGEKVVSDSFGYDRIRSLRDLLRGQDEASAQMRAGEVLYLSSENAGSDSSGAIPARPPRQAAGGPIGRRSEAAGSTEAHQGAFDAVQT